MKKMLVFAFSLLPPLLPLLFPSGSADAQIAKEKPLMTKVLPDISGQEGLIETVVLSPGEVVPSHRHNADVFAYVLEGSIVTQLEGQKSQTVHSGEVFYESPGDVHIATRNASATQPAKLLVFFVKKIGAPTTVAVPTANSGR
jgi:quercetin dioxygenase-like cupin family protein